RSGRRSVPRRRGAARAPARRCACRDPSHRSVCSERNEPKELTVRIAITGTTSGIGREAVGVLVARGHEVVALGRGVDRLRGALAPEVAAEVEFHDLDLADPVSIRAAAESVAAAGPLDALVHNAAVFDQRASAARFTPVGHELFWA